MATAISLDALAFEGYLVTETLSTLWVVLAASTLIGLRAHPRPRLADAFSLGVVLSLAGLTKPFLLGLVPFALAAWWWPHDPVRARPLVDRRFAVTWTALLMLPVLLLVGGWSLFNLRTQGVFGPSTMTGYRLSQHVGSVMQDPPEEYRTLREIFVAHRDTVMARTGSPINTIWTAIPDMQRARGLSYGRLSLEVQRMPAAVAWRHPAVWLRSSARPSARSASRSTVRFY